MDVARINLEHSDYDFCTDIVNKINEVNEELDTNVAIMFDTRGPEIRTGKITGGKAKLEKGSKIRIYSEKLKAKTKQLTPCICNLSTGRLLMVAN